MPASPRRRAFGQHFLRDAKTIETIVQTALDGARAHGCRGLLEIGPGKGAITDLLLANWRSVPTLEHFRIVEKDRKLADEWIAKTRDLQRLEILSADFLELKPENWLSHSPLAVVSNLPYSAGTAIATEMAAHPERIPVMVLMFQKEVAERLRASPSTKAFGSLSLWIQNRWDVRKLLAVPPGAFIPPPEVDSEVVVLTARKEPILRLSDEEAKTWEKLVRMAYQHRRKMLRASIPKNSPYAKALAESGIDPTLRAENLGFPEWQKWMDALRKLS